MLPFVIFGVRLKLMLNDCPKFDVLCISKRKPSVLDLILQLLFVVYSIYSICYLWYHTNTATSSRWTENVLHRNDSCLDKPKGILSSTMKEANPYPMVYPSEPRKPGIPQNMKKPQGIHKGSFNLTHRSGLITTQSDHTCTQSIWAYPWTFIYF